MHLEFLIIVFFCCFLNPFSSLSVCLSLYFGIHSPLPTIMPDRDELFPSSCKGKEHTPPISQTAEQQGGLNEFKCVLKGTSREGACWPESVQNLQIFPSEAFLWRFFQYSTTPHPPPQKKIHTHTQPTKILPGFQLEVISAQRCLFTPYQ